MLGSGQNLNEPQARELYLHVRDTLIQQTREHFKLNEINEEEGMTMKDFVKWLDCYSFIRTIIRESLMPRIWTLRNQDAVPIPRQLSLNEKSKQTRNSTKTPKTQNLNAGKAEKSRASEHKNQMSPTSKTIMKMQCIVPTDSKIIKVGELLKIGKRTGTMRSRFYILRDQALFIYNNKN